MLLQMYAYQFNKPIKRKKLIKRKIQPLKITLKTSDLKHKYEEQYSEDEDEDEEKKSVNVSTMETIEADKQ